MNVVNLLDLLPFMCSQYKLSGTYMYMYAFHYGLATTLQWFPLASYDRVNKPQHNHVIVIMRVTWRVQILNYKVVTLSPYHKGSKSDDKVGDLPLLLS